MRYKRLQRCVSVPSSLLHWAFLHGRYVIALVCALQSVFCGQPKMGSFYLSNFKSTKSFTLDYIKCGLTPTLTLRTCLWRHESAPSQHAALCRPSRFHVISVLSLSPGFILSHAEMMKTFLLKSHLMFAYYICYRHKQLREQSLTFWSVGMHTQLTRGSGNLESQQVDLHLSCVMNIHVIGCSCQS